MNLQMVLHCQRTDRNQRGEQQAVRENLPYVFDRLPGRHIARACFCELHKQLDHPGKISLAGQMAQGIVQTAGSGGAKIFGRTGGDDFQGCGGSGGSSGGITQPAFAL